MRTSSGASDFSFVTPPNAGRVREAQETLDYSSFQGYEEDGHNGTRHDVHEVATREQFLKRITPKGYGQARTNRLDDKINHGYDAFMCPEDIDNLMLPSREDVRGIADKQSFSREMAKRQKPSTRPMTSQEMAGYIEVANLDLAAQNEEHAELTGKQTQQGRSNMTRPKVTRTFNPAGAQLGHKRQVDWYSGIHLVETNTTSRFKARSRLPIDWRAQSMSAQSVMPGAGVGGGRVSKGSNGGMGILEQYATDESFIQRSHDVMPSIANKRSEMQQRLAEGMRDATVNYADSNRLDRAYSREMHAHAPLPIVDLEFEGRQLFVAPPPTQSRAALYGTKRVAAIS